MAVVTGNDYDHIDIVNGSTQTRHMIKDASARADISNLKSAIDSLIDDTNIFDATNVDCRALFINVSSNTIRSANTNRLIVVPIKTNTAYMVSCAGSSTKRVATTVANPALNVATSNISEFVGEITNHVVNNTTGNYLVIQLFVDSDADQTPANYYSSIIVNELSAKDQIARQDVDSIKSALSNVQSVIEKEEIVNTVSLINGYRYIYSSNPVGNTPALSSGTGKYCIVDVGLAKNGGTLKIEIDQLTTNETISLLLTDDDKIITYIGVASNVLVLNQETGKYERTYTLTNQKYLYFSANTSSTNISITINAKQLVVDKTLSIEGAAADAEAVGDALRTLKTVEETLQTGGDYVYSSNPPGNTPVMRSGTAYGVHKTIDISFAAGGTVTLETPSFVQNGQIATLICDENETIIARQITQNFLSLQDGVYRGRIKVPTNAKFLLYSAYRNSSTSLTLTMQKKDNQNLIRYVATNGDDTADGMSASTPMATITKAINSGGQTILLAGGKYFQNIDLTTAVNEIHIAPSNKDALPVLYAPSSLVTETETAVAGYTKVYSCECTQTFDDKNIWIFQDGVPDTSTAITTDDRHPLQRGKAYRCDDTKIVLCTATTLADALAEIENASVYKWFIDTENHVLYFSRPQAVTQANPIMASFGGSVFQNITRGIHIEMTGIGVKYQKVNLIGMIAPVLTDCFCGNIRGAAAFQWDGTSGARLYRCEAFRVFYSSSSGDGFNAHSDNTGDAFAKQTGCFLFDCWAHDNCDDGYSDHERCEITIFGGLFENNGAGVTPAVGSHCTCYNVLSRYNGEADFFYTGNPASAEGGVGGQIACYGCVSKGTGTGRGFRLNGSEIQGLFVDCVVIDRQYGFFSESNGGTQVGTLINCSTVNCSTPKSSIFNAINGVPVT